MVVYLIERFGDKNRSVVVAYVRVGALLIIAMVVPTGSLYAQDLWVNFILWSK